MSKAVAKRRSVGRRRRLIGFSAKGKKAVLAAGVAGGIILASSFGKRKKKRGRKYAKA